MAAPISPLLILAACSLRVALASGSYEAFRRAHGRAGAEGEDAVSLEVRQGLFHRRQAAVLAHNARNTSWKMALNRYSDYTDAELRSMLGYKRVGPRWSGRSSPSGASSFLQTRDFEDFNVSGLASEVDWRKQVPKSASFFRNQGGCGSCWAVAAVGAMEMHTEKAQGVAKRLSHQQVVDCTPNPKHCGGTGGCHGATGELAFQYAQHHVVSGEDEYSGQGDRCDMGTQPQPTVSSFVRLPENKVKPLFHALATRGPVVVSLDGGNWFGYDSGVFSGCDKDTVVNHAVLAVGYGNDHDASKKDYWLIRNSWGSNWGEQGHMRIERHMNDDYCGVDNDPQAGVFCDNGPKSVPVCGMCGITSDSAFPVVDPHGSKVRAKGVAKHLRQGSAAQAKLGGALQTAGAATGTL